MKKKIINFTVFWLIFLLLFQGLSKVLIPKWNDRTTVTGTRTADFYKQEKNTMDAMIFGSSYSYYSMSPLPIWDNYGFTVYAFGNPAQRIWTSYYYMEEAFKHQKPKVVFFEVGNAYVEEQGAEVSNRQNIDYLPMSLTKLKAIKDICKGTKETVASYLFPLLRYHDRWKDLTQNDFDSSLDTGYYGKGSLMRFGAKPAKKKNVEKWMTDTGENITFPKENEEYLDKMIKLCKKNESELVLVRFPNVYWTQNHYKMMQEMADKKGLTYIDYNTMPEAYGLNWSTDTTDKGEHMNVVGTRKVSNYLGQYMKEHYDFKDKRQDKDYVSWVENSKNFKTVYEKNRIANIVNINEYLNKIREDCYTAVITVKGNALGHLSEETKEILRAMGVSEGMMTNKESSYIGIMDSGKIIDQKEGNLLLEYQSMVGDIKVKAVSGGRLFGNISNTLIDGKEYSPNNTGINIVVYDKDLKRVADSVSFNTTKKSNKISRRLQNNANDEF